MNNYCLLKALESEEVTETLEEVYYGKSTLCMHLPMDDFMYLMPEKIWREANCSSGENVDLQHYTLAGGFYEFADSEGVAACLLFDGVGEIQNFAFKDARGNKLILVGWGNWTGDDENLLTSNSIFWLGENYFDKDTFEDRLAVLLPDAQKDAPINLDENRVKTKEFAAALWVWDEYWADGKDGITKDALVHELVTEHGFTTPSAKAIDRVTRPEHAREGRRSKKK